MSCPLVQDFEVLRNLNSVEFDTVKTIVLGEFFIFLSIVRVG